MGIFFQIALRNLLLSRRRSLFLSLAVAIVTALLVLLNSLSAGISSNVVMAATTLSAGHVNVAGFHKSKPSDSSPIVTNMSELRDILKETPGLEYMIDRHRGWAKLVSPTAAIQAGLYGIDASQEVHLFKSLQLAETRDYVPNGTSDTPGNPEELAKPNTAMLFASQAKRLNVAVGDVITVRAESPGGRTNTVDLTVVAVMRDVGLLSSWSVFMPKETLLELYQLSDSTTGGFMLYLKDIDDAQATMGTLRTTLAQKGYTLMDYRPEPFFFKFEQVAGEDWTGQRLDLTTWKDEVNFLTWILTALNTVSFSLIAILFAIIAIGIANTMIISVRERTREIGTLRAVGMHKRQVLLMFMLEALILGFVATVVGALSGALISVLLTAAEIEVPIEAVRAILLSDVLHLKVEPVQTAISILVLTLFTGISALWPALRGARMQPVDALQAIE